MSDNLTANPGSGGATFRTDDVGSGVQIPYAKLNAGGDGVDAPVVFGQATKANSLPVTLASNQDALPVTDNSGSLTIDSPGVPTALGQAAMAASMPVVIASNQSAVAVSGTVTANAGTGPFPVSDNAGSLTVDAPVTTPVFVRLSDGSAAITALPITDNSGSLTIDTPQLASTLGQKTMANSAGVVIASDQTVIPVSDNSGSLTVDSTQYPASLGQKAMAASFAVALASDQSALPITDNSGSLTIDAPVGTPAFVRLSDGSTGGGFGSGSDTAAQRASLSNANAVARDAVVSTNPVTVGGRASTAVPGAVSADGDSVDVWLDRNGATIQATRPCTSGGPANVAGSASSVTLIALNTGRRGFTIWNDSSAILYVKFGATASTTSCHVKMVADAYYESPAGFLYTGVIDGIWASATGSARIGEFT